jgi:hypothetical protein
MKDMFSERKALPGAPRKTMIFCSVKVQPEEGLATISELNLAMFLKIVENRRENGHTGRCGSTHRFG